MSVKSKCPTNLSRSKERPRKELHSPYLSRKDYCFYYYTRARADIWPITMISVVASWHTKLFHMDSVTISPIL